MIRTLLTIAIVPALWVTGFRFGKDYRHGTTRWHRAVYRLVDTSGANLRAGLWD